MVDRPESDGHARPPGSSNPNWDGGYR
jgi:hypothetical protein